MWEKFQESVRRWMKQGLSALSFILSPLTSVEDRRINVSFLGAIKNRFLKAIGRGAPFQDDANEIRSSQSEKKRGNVFNPSFANDGRLTLRLMDGLVNEGALLMLDALDNSEIEKFSDAKKALAALALRMNTKVSKDVGDAFTKLYALRLRLEEKGGSLALDRSHDGFGRVLVIKICIVDKSEEDIKREINDIFKTIGISDPELAKSISKQLLKRGTAEFNRTGCSSSVNPREYEDSLAKFGDDQVVGEDVSQEKDGSAVKGFSRLVKGADSRSSAGGAAKGGDELSDESFSMSGTAIPSVFAEALVNADPAARQFQFLKGESTLKEVGSSNGMSTSLDVRSPTMVSPEEIKEVALGFDVVDPCVTDSQLPGQPTLSPTAQKAEHSSSRKM